MPFGIVSVSVFFLSQMLCFPQVRQAAGKTLAIYRGNWPGRNLLHVEEQLFEAVRWLLCFSTFTAQCGKARLAGNFRSQRAAIRDLGKSHQFGRNILPSVRVLLFSACLLESFVHVFFLTG